MIRVFVLLFLLFSLYANPTIEDPGNDYKIASLLDFPSLPPGAMVILDIDDTLILREDPSIKGLSIRYQKDLQKKTKNPLFQEMIMAALFSHLKVELAEGDHTLDAFSQLREQSRYLFALTSRPATDYHAPTGMYLIQQLRDFGLYFTPTILGRDFFYYQEGDLQFQFHDGVIFGARQTKGLVLLHFLEKMKQRPSFLLLIDDFEGGNVALRGEVEKSLAAFCPTLCLMYTHGTEKRNAFYSSKKNEPKIRKFISEGVWEGDESAFYPMIPYSILVRYFDIFEEHLSQIEHLNSPHSPVMIGISGTPGMGKSTFAKTVQDNFEAIRISSDQVRTLMRQKEISMSPQQIEQYLYAFMHFILAHYPNRLIILDSALERKIDLLGGLLDQFDMDHLWVRLEMSKEETMKRIAEKDFSLEKRSNLEKTDLYRLIDEAGYFEEYLESPNQIDFDLVIENDEKIDISNRQEIVHRFLDPIERVLKDQL